MEDHQVVAQLYAELKRQPLDRDDVGPILRHISRFRKVSNRYALRVTEAYDGDIEQAASDTDEQVAARVAEWERGQGMEPKDWAAIGREERDES